MKVSINISVWTVEYEKNSLERANLYMSANMTDAIAGGFNTRMIDAGKMQMIISEASMDLMAQRKYVFKVAKTADKGEIARAVEAMFPGTKVEAVNTINMKRKPKRYGVHFGYTTAWKKAIVTLTADSKTIEFFEGMN